MDMIEFTGKTAEDALRAAQEHFGLSLDQLEVEVVSAGSSGFFGILGAKKAMIKARPQGKSDADEVAAMVADFAESAAPRKPAPKPAPSAAHRPSPRHPTHPVRPPAATRLPAAPRPEPPQAKPAPPAPPAPPAAPALAEAQPLAPAPAVSPAPTPAPAPEMKPAEPKLAEAGPEQVEVLEFGRQVLERLAQGLDPNASVEVIKGEQGPALSIMGADPGVVIGRRGQTLDALQYLVTRIASHKFGRAVHLGVDAGGYRQRRRAALEDSARRMADKARATRKAQSIGPLNSLERRLVHLVLRSQRGISTVSRGKGEMKKVVITPR